MVLRLIFSRTSLLTTIGGSSPLGSGVQDGRLIALAGFLVVIGSAFAAMGELMMPGGGGIDVTPAQVEGACAVLGVVESPTRSISFSERKMLSNFNVGRPVAKSSRTTGGPSIIVIRFRSSWLTSSRKGA